MVYPVRRRAGVIVTRGYPFIAIAPSPGNERCNARQSTVHRRMSLMSLLPEIEVKLEVPEADLPRLTASPLLKDASKSAAQACQPSLGLFRHQQAAVPSEGLIAAGAANWPPSRTDHQAGKQWKHGSVCSRRMGTQRLRETARSRRSA